MRNKTALCFALAVIMMMLGSKGKAEPELSMIAYPKAASQQAVFFVTTRGDLAWAEGNRSYVWDGSRWRQEHEKPDVAFEVVEEGMALSVLKDGKVFFTSQDFDTLAPLSDTLCFATRNATLFSVDMASGKARALCNIGDLGAGDHFDALAASQDAVYAIQKDAKWIYRMDAKWALNNTDRMLTLVDTTAGIGNAVLGSANQSISDKQPGVSMGIVRRTADQVRLGLLAGDDSIDLMAIAPAMLRQLAQAGRLIDLAGNADIRTILEQQWYDMRALCQVDGRWAGLPLWDNINMFLVSDELLSRLNLSLPDAGWNYDDLLSLARAARRDLDGDGRADTYLCYARYQRNAQVDAEAPAVQSVYFTPLVQQILALCQDGKIAFTDERILGAMDVWKTCVNEGLILDASASHDTADYQRVLLPMTAHIMWAKPVEYADFRVGFPAIASGLAVHPAQTIFLCANRAGKKADLAVDFIKTYMTTGADEHGYLRAHHFERNTFLSGKNPGYRAPDDYQAAHYQNALESARRIDWDLPLHEYMEAEFARFLAGQISARECAQSWADRVLMMRME